MFGINKNLNEVITIWRDDLCYQNTLIQFSSCQSATRCSDPHTKQDNCTDCFPVSETARHYSVTTPTCLSWTNYNSIIGICKNEMNHSYYCLARLSIQLQGNRQCLSGECEPNYYQKEIIELKPYISDLIRTWWCRDCYNLQYFIPDNHLVYWLVSLP